MKKTLTTLSFLLGLVWVTTAHAQVVPSAADTVGRIASGTTTTQTVTGVLFGSAFSNRVIVVVLNTDTLTTPTVTVGGISATVSGSTATQLFIASAIVPTGTSGTVVINGTGMTGGGTFGVFSLAGAANATQFDSAFTASGGSVNIDSPADGAIVAVAFSNTSPGIWTGATQNWVDTSLGPTVSGASYASSSSVTARLISYSTGVNMSAASFSPSGLPPPSTLHMIPLLGVGK